MFIPFDTGFPLVRIIQNIGKVKLTGFNFNAIKKLTT